MRKILNGHVAGLSGSVRVSFAWTPVTDRTCPSQHLRIPRLHPIRRDEETSVNTQHGATAEGSLCKIDHLRNETNTEARRPNAPRSRLEDRHASTSSKTGVVHEYGCSQPAAPTHDREHKCGKLRAGTQRGYIGSCKQFAAFLKRSPDTATSEDIRRFQLYLAETGASICNRNRVMTGLD